MSTETAAARPGRPGWALFVVAIGVFLTSLDVVVVATALPTIQQKLGASLPQLEWTINAYNLVFACLVLTGAALGDRFGRTRMYVIGLGLFTLASVVAALSPSADVLILARVLQGAAAAVAMPLSLTLLSDNFPAEKRGVAMGLWGAIAGIGIAAGPVIGGLVTQGLSWEWIFWLNVPFGVAATVLSLMLRETHGPRPKLDIRGLVLAGIGLFALTWAAVHAPAQGWGSVEVIGALVVGVAFMYAFIRWEQRAPYPMIPLSYFRNRGFATGNIVGFFQQFSVIGALFTISQLFQTGLGNGPLATGLKILVWTATPFVIAPIAGGLSDRFGNKPFMSIGLSLQAVGLVWLASVTGPGVGYGAMIVPLIVAGVGISMCFPTMTSLVLSSVPPNDTGIAAGANNAVKELGGVFGVALAGAAFALFGSYATATTAIDGFRAALVLAGLASAAGVIAALLSPGRRPSTAPSGDAAPATAAPEPAKAAG